MEWIEKKYSQFVQKWCMSSKYKKSCIFISVYTILFLFSFVLAFSPFLLEKKSFIWQSDGRTQHYKTLVYIGRYLRQIILNLFRGDFSIPLVDINIALGADIIATLNYYGLGEKAFPVMLEELKKASKFIFLEYFIINNGIMWDSILKILEEKVSEGVEVRVIYDDAGCISTLKKDYNKFLESKGIKCVVFNKLNPLSGVIMNNRDHRKILIVDGRVAFSGGINISDEYINEKKLYGHWKDNAIKIVGEGVFNFTVLFLTMWNAYREEDKDYNLFKYEFNDTIKQDGFVVPYGETPLDSEIVGEDIYLNIINQSHKYLYIMTPYLIIDTDMINSLVLAAKRGVDVRIIIPGVPDKKIVYSLSESYLQILVEGGVKIYKYTPGFVHSKMFLSDDLVSVVGTINLDYRSLYLHFECGVYLEGHSSIKKIKNDFEESFKVSHKLSKKEATPGLIKAIWQTVLRLFAPLM